MRRGELIDTNNDLQLHQRNDLRLIIKINNTPIIKLHYQVISCDHCTECKKKKIAVRLKSIALNHQYLIGA